MKANSLSVGIVGGGVGGLALAIALRKSNVAVTLFETAKSFNGYGAGIQLTSNGVKVLRYLDLESELEKKSFRTEKIMLKRAESGKNISEIKLGDFARKRYSAFFYLTHRNDLVQILAKKAENVGVKLCLGEKANLTKGNSDMFKIKIQDKVLDFDVIVGADGINSNSRTTVFPKTKKSKFLKQVAYRATVPFDKVDKLYTKPNVNLYLGSGCHLVCYPLSNQSLVNLVFCKDQEVWSAKHSRVSVDKAELRENFGHFHGIESLINNAQKVRKWGLFGYESEQSWASGNVVFLGDACHPMLPYLAQGANQALEDSIALSHFLLVRKNLDLKAIFKQYETNRSKRVARIQKTATRNSYIYHLSKGPVQFILHIGLWIIAKLMPNFLISRFDWLYKYEFRVEF